MLDKAEVIVEAGINAQKQFAQNVLRGLTEEEKHMCINVFDKICNNAEEYLREYKERHIMKRTIITTDSRCDGSNI